MIELHVDEAVLFEEFGGVMGETIRLNRQEILESNENSFDDITESSQRALARDFHLFFRGLANDPNIKGVAISSLPNKLMHLDYFCNGESGADMTRAISTIESTVPFIGETPGSIWWLDRNKTVENMEGVFRSQLSQKELFFFLTFT